MRERRRHNRLPIYLKLEINELFKQDYVRIENLDERIEVVNISKTGIGFYSKTDLPLNFYFNAKIEFKEGQYFFCVLKIIRKEEGDKNILYGCEFIGLAEFLAKKVDEYEITLQNKEI